MLDDERYYAAAEENATAPSFIASRLNKKGKFTLDFFPTVIFMALL